MKHIVAVNAGPRKKWNTAQMLAAACEGAQEAGASVESFNLFDLEKFSGCISCFGCKLEKNLGRCVCKDGLTKVLEAIRTADGLIIGTPNYLGDGTAEYRALYERLIFQYITYKAEIKSYNDRPIPVLTCPRISAMIPTLRPRLAAVLPVLRISGTSMGITLVFLSMMLRKVMRLLLTMQ